MRKSILAVALLFASAAMAVIGAASQAQEQFPNHAIHIIVPFNAGGAADIVARVVGQSISEKVGQPVIVENRAGATGAIGSVAVAHSAPDGYTILMAVISSHAVTPAMKKDPPFDPVKDFTPIVRVANSVQTLVARNDFPAHNVRELIAYAKANPSKVTYGSSGLTSFPFLGAKMMEKAAGIEMTHVPFSGDQPAMTAVVTKNLDILFTPSARPYVEANSVKLLGIASLKRNPSTPNWPTLDESGLPGFELVSWVGFMGPSGMARPTVDLINRATNQALTDPAVITKLDQIGYTVGGGSPDEFAATVRNDVEHIRALNIQVD